MKAEITALPESDASPLPPHGFPILDTLRAVGALAVVTTHTAFQSGDYLGHGVGGIMLSRLDVGVAIFFVLSGFLLSRPYISAARTGRPRPATGRYYWKRLLRVYPVYVVSVVVALIFIDENAGVGVRDWVTTLLLGDSYVADRLPQGLTQMWSLAVEVAFYLLLPALMLLALGRGRLRPRRVALVLAGMLVVAVLWHLLVAGWLEPRAPGSPSTWLPAYLSWFAVGIGLALLHELHRAGSTHRLVRAARTLGAMPGACWSMVLGLMLVAATPLAGPALLFVATPAESAFKNLLYAVVGGLVVVTGVFPDHGSRYARVTSAPLLRHLGLISYSTFCIHLVVLAAVMEVFGFELFVSNGWQVWGLTVVFSLVVSEVLYRLVELPSARFRDIDPPWRRWSSSPSGDTATATSR